DGDNLMTGETGSYEMIAFSYLEVETLVIADNLLANAGHRVVETLIRAASDDAEIVVRNNVLINNVMAWRAFSAKFRHQPARYRFLHNSFLLNWPNNPDRSTSNPAALELGDRHSAGTVEIRGNVFAFNIGGALHAGFDGDLAPTMVVHDNLFWGNGVLFELDDPGLASVVGKFNRSRKYIPLHPDDFVDELEWDAGGNVVLDPHLRVQIRPFQGFDSTESAEAPEKTDRQGGGGDRVGDPWSAGGESVETEVEEGAGSDELLLEDGERDSLLQGGSLDDLEEGFDLSVGDVLDDDPTDEGEDPAAGDLDDFGGDDFGTSAFDADFDDGFQDLGWGGGAMETFHAEGFASRIYLDAPELPFPREETAKAYGASPERVDRED
ncbi:MAG: hypothetical protein MI919_07875, partial [Holophagales bacterium]|nr:hypothetical protein [Holophagales bacterium]